MKSKFYKSVIQDGKEFELFYTKIKFSSIVMGIDFKLNLKTGGYYYKYNDFEYTSSSMNGNKPIDKDRFVYVLFCKELGYNWNVLYDNFEFLKQNNLL